MLTIGRKIKCSVTFVMLFSKAYATKLNIPTQGLQGSRPPNILTSVLFFPFSGTSEYRKSLSFSVVLAIVFTV